MTADARPVRVIRLVRETGQTNGDPTAEGTGRRELDDAPGLTVVNTTDDPAAAGARVRAGEADCVVGEGADGNDTAATLTALRADAAEVPFLTILPDSDDEEAAAETLLAAPATDLVREGEASLPALVARRAANLVATSRVERLAREREQVDQALDTLTDLFYVIDADGRMARWNRRFNDWWGLTDDEIAEMRLWEFLVEGDQPAVKEAIGEALSQGEAAVRARAALPDGRAPMLELHGRRLTDDDGQLLGLCGTARDVSDQVAREASLRTRNEQLGEFASVLSHDLRNPLAVAVGSLEVAREEWDSPDLERAATALGRLDEIISEVLLTARQGRAVTDPVSVSLQTIARAAWDTVSTGDATLEVETNAVVRADPARLRRILENLFRNSIEHGSTERPPLSEDGGEDDTPADDGVTVTVAALSDESGSVTGFVVADDGPGIPETDRERVFDRGHSTGDGPGLGLAVVRSLAEAHGWRVTLGDGPGARFEFHDVDVVPAAD